MILTHDLRFHIAKALLRSHIKSWRFLSTLQIPALSQQEFTVKVFPSKLGAIPCLHFESGHGTPLVLVNGYAARGHKDLRMRNLASALSKAGHEVWLPVIEPIEHLELTTRAIDYIETITKLIAEHHQSQISMIAPSIGGSLSLIALSRMSQKSVVRAYCGIGIYADLQSCVQHVVESGDNYGCLLILLNYYHLLWDKSENLDQGIRTAINDNARMGTGLLSAFIRSLNDKGSKEILLEFLKDPRYARKKAAKIVDIMQKDENFSQSMDPIKNLKSISTEHFFLHGKEDMVIPAQQSEILHQRIQELGSTSKILKTGLLSHADIKWSLDTLGSVYQLEKFFASFFNSAQNNGVLQPNDQTRRWKEETLRA